MSQNVSTRKDAFLTAYAISGTVSKSAEAAGIDRRTHYHWMENDPEYPARFEDAHQQACEALEDEARRRATEGLRRLKFGKDGKPLIDPETGKPYVEHAYSDLLLIFLMKGAMPDKYRERVEQQHSGGVQYNHSGEITIQQIAEEIQNDDKFLEFARHRAGASGADSDAGHLRPTNGNGKVAVCSPPPGDRPGGHGHGPGKNGTDSGH